MLPRSAGRAAIIHPFFPNLGCLSRNRSRPLSLACANSQGIVFQLHGSALLTIEAQSSHEISSAFSAGPESSTHITRSNRNSNFSTKFFLAANHRPRSRRSTSRCLPCVISSSLHRSPGEPPVTSTSSKTKGSVSQDGSPVS